MEENNRQNQDQNQDQNRNLKILLLDDDSFLLEMYTRKFQNSGFEVAAISNSKEALMDIKNGETADILLFDMIMPQMDGLEFITEIKKENLLPNAVKIVLSNQGQKEDVEKVEKVGVDGYIVKALYTPSEVVAEVNKIYNNKN